MKKFISVMLAALMLASTMSATIVSAEEVAEPVYVVAGSESLCGLSWNGNPEEATDNIMTFSDDVYTKVFENVAVGENYEIKVVENNVGSDPVWIGNNGTDFNVVFNVVEACDVTVTLSADKIITVSGDGVTFPEGLDIENMFVVGNAADETDPWMNGAAWNPSAEVNKMEEVAENVYSITFEGVEMFEDGYQGKFAANGAWTHSWGGVYTESGVAFDAVYNGDNIVVPVSYETANVTLTLDLSAFDFATKTGAKATITVEDAAVEDTTASEEVEDTTASEEVTDPVEDTTASEEVTDPVEDTTASEEVTDPVEDTTASEEVTDPVEDTTASEEVTDPVEDTTASEEVTDPVAEDVYVVAGSEQLCGVNWNGNAEEAPENVMVGADGVYTKVFTNVKTAEGLQIKVVKNNTDWIGDETGNNVTFNVTTACDVTVTYDVATGKITVTGEGVELVMELEYESVYAVGNAADESDPWMNGAAWNQAAEVNKMTMVSEGVYTITFENVEMFEEGYQAKFALDGEWTHSWGGAYTESGVAFEGVYNGDNVVIPVLYELADVTLTLDLSNFDYATKTGAVITVTVTDAKEVEVLFGDVDGSGVVDVDDVTYLQMYLAGYEGYEVDPAVLGKGEAGDATIDVDDVTGIQFMLAGLVVG